MLRVKMKIGKKCMHSGGAQSDLERSVDGENTDGNTDDIEDDDGSGPDVESEDGDFLAREETYARRLLVVASLQSSAASFIQYHSPSIVGQFV
jgi:hypothetical protein